MVGIPSAAVRGKTVQMVRCWKPSETKGPMVPFAFFQKQLWCACLLYYALYEFSSSLRVFVYSCLCLLVQ